jgi:hypothetical protein
VRKSAANRTILTFRQQAISQVCAFPSPFSVTRQVFGEVPSGPVSLVVARHWGLLLFCVGALLVYAAFHPALRVPAMVLASVEKGGFVACVLGTSLRQRITPLILALFDALMLLLYVLYLASV